MHVDKVIVSYGRMRIYLSFEPEEEKFTNLTIASRAQKAYPSLLSHSCINSLGPTFASVIECTSLAHLLEHLMIAEQSEMAASKGIEDVTFVGMTQWVGDGQVLAEVQVSFIDDMDAAVALSKSLSSIEGFLAG